MELSTWIRDVDDFPEPGVVFKDITPLLADPGAFAAAADAMADPFGEHAIDVVVGIEARGFIFGPPVAQRLGVGFVPVRKPGKLPADTASVSYSLEYGSDTLEIHIDGLEAGDRVLLVDDVLATGGTLDATASLVRGLGATVVGASVLIELAFLDGRGRLTDIDLHAPLRVQSPERDPSAPNAGPPSPGRAGRGGA